MVTARRTLLSHTKICIFFNIQHPWLNSFSFFFQALPTAASVANSFAYVCIFIFFVSVPFFVFFFERMGMSHSLFFFCCFFLYFRWRKIFIIVVAFLRSRKYNIFIYFLFFLCVLCSLLFSLVSNFMYFMLFMEKNRTQKQQQQQPKYEKKGKYVGIYKMYMIFLRPSCMCDPHQKKSREYKFRVRKKMGKITEKKVQKKFIRSGESELFRLEGWFFAWEGGEDFFLNIICSGDSRTVMLLMIMRVVWDVGCWWSRRPVDLNAQREGQKGGDDTTQKKLYMKL